MPEKRAKLRAGLEPQLQPILGQIRVIGLEPQTRYQLVKDYFENHEENMASNIADLAYLCSLPNEDRHLLTYPVIGNWFLDKISSFIPQTLHQARIFGYLIELIKENRFCNTHMKRFYEDVDGYNQRIDKFNSLLLALPDESMIFHRLLRRITAEIEKVVYDRNLPINPNNTTDLGHGIVSPADNFSYLTWHLSVLVKDKMAKPIDKTIMIIDDERAKEWYERMIAVGFKAVEGQQGYFTDCESALEALKQGRYDVILSDLNLGEGKMNGIVFVAKAFEIQREKGIEPIISVFSHDDEALGKADDIYFRPSAEEEQKIFDQTMYSNNKARFTAIGFRNRVSTEIKIRSM